MQFRKKPVVIEAFQFQQPMSLDQSPEWLIEAIRENTFLVVEGVARITTLEGVMTAQPGDWMIRGVKGELYPCKPDIFAVTYEQAGGAQPAPGAAHAGYSAMQPHQQRVVDERAELDGKRVKLLAFFNTPTFNSLAAEERARLSAQAHAMETYSLILGERIAAFTPAASA